MESRINGASSAVTATSLLSFVRVFPFSLGLLVGLFLVFVLGPATLPQWRYPNAENASQLVYRDRNGTCFRYDLKTVDCDKNEARITAFPLQ